MQRRRGVQSPGGLSLIVGHNDAGGCARSVHKLLEKQTQASLVLTPPASFAVRSAFSAPGPLNLSGALLTLVLPAAKPYLILYRDLSVAVNVRLLHVFRVTSMSRK